MSLVEYETFSREPPLSNDALYAPAFAAEQRAEGNSLYSFWFVTGAHGPHPELVTPEPAAEVAHLVFADVTFVEVESADTSEVAAAA